MMIILVEKLHGLITPTEICTIKEAKAYIIKTVIKPTGIRILVQMTFEMKL